MEGYENEYNFVLCLNNKKVCELNPILHDLVCCIFKNVKDEDLIKSWTNHYKQKTDVFIKIGDTLKGISIKMGSRNSVHVESIQEFVFFLIDHGVPNNIVNDYLSFHYADGTINNTGVNRVSAEEYKKDNQSKIDLINEYFNDTKILLDAIDRFLLIGNNSDYSIDAIIFGVPNDFLWLSRNDIIDYLLSNKRYCSSPHFGELICQPMNRCLNYNEKYEKFREYIQIKWYSLFDSIIEQMNNNFIRKNGRKFSDY